MTFYTAQTIARLLEMRSVKDSAVWLYSTKYRNEWTALFELESTSLNVKITKTAATPEDAVAACYDAWQSLQTGVPDAKPSLLIAPEPQLPPDDAVPF